MDDKAERGLPGPNWLKLFISSNLSTQYTFFSIAPKSQGTFSTGKAIKWQSFGDIAICPFLIWLSGTYSAFCVEH
jgi:hypothetical protein